MSLDDEGILLEQLGGRRAGNLLTRIPTLFASVFMYNPLGIPEFDPVDLIDRENSAYVKTRGVSERFD